MSTERLAELDRLIAHWRMILTVARNKAANHYSTDDDRKSVKFAEDKMNQYVDQRLVIMGAPREAAPICQSGPCTQIKATYGTRTWLCGVCDFRSCVGCQERVMSLTAVECSHCGFIVGAPRSADDELD